MQPSFANFHLDRKQTDGSDMVTEAADPRPCDGVGEGDGKEEGGGEEEGQGS